jgi:flavin reductase
VCAGVPLPAEPESVDVRRFRDAAGRFATGVTLVSAHVDGQDHAMTVNTFTSVSLHPVLVLICIERSARLHDLIVAAGGWGVSVLGDDHEHVSRAFARRGRQAGDGIERVPHHHGPLTGAVLLDDALATFECRTTGIYPGGDHSVLLGAVLGVDLPRSDLNPLVYYRGEYRVLGE